MATSRSTSGGSTVLSAENIQVIARPGIRIVWQQASMALRNMEHDRPRLEQGEITFFIGWNLPERMKRPMRGFLHLIEPNKTNLDYPRAEASASSMRRRKAARRRRPNKVS
jgi:hypothetical protein